MASISIEFAAFLDPRFKILARISGLSRFDAIGRMGAIWVYCVEKSETVLPSVLVDVLAELDGYAKGVVEAGLGEALDSDQVRIRGTDGRIEWLARARSRQRTATEAARIKRLPNVNPILDPKSDPNSDPTSVTTSASASASASASNSNTIVQRKRRTRSFSCRFDLESAYQRYPRKEGRTKGLERLAAQIETQEDFDALLVAIDRYSRSSAVRDGFVKLFSTFASEWRDWTQENAGSVSSRIDVPLHMVEPV